MGLLAVVFGLLLGYAAVRFRVESDPVVDQVDALLPQTQCGQCSYAGCRPYAEAITAGEADINRCPPGGETTIAALADGYSFPTNLDSDPPIEGKAPETAQQMLHTALRENWPPSRLKEALTAYALRRQS